MALSAWLQMEQLKKCLTLAVFPLVVHELPEGCLGHLQKDGDILVAKLKSLVNGWNFPLCEKVPNVHRNLSLRERINIGWLSTSTSWNFTSHTSSFTFYLFPHTLHRMHRNTTRLSSSFASSFPKNVRLVRFSYEKKQYTNVILRYPTVKFPDVLPREAIVASPRQKKVKEEMKDTSCPRPYWNSCHLFPTEML